MILVYDTQTGIIRRWSQAYLPDELGPGEAIYVTDDDDIDPASVYVLGSDLMALPPRPDFLHRWDGQQWIDPRTPADHAAALAARREAASLAKSDLLMRMATHDLISWDEAALAAAGQIPPSIVPMMEAMPPDARAAAIIKWTADPTISRNHRVILAAAYAMGLTAEIVDHIFGVEA